MRGSYDVIERSIARSDQHSVQDEHKEKQLFRMDTKVSCPELFGTTRNVRLKADIIIKRREVSQEIRIDTGIQNGGFWLSIGSTAGHENGISFAHFISTRPSLNS